MNTELKNFYTDDVAQKREDLFKNSAFQNDTQQEFINTIGIYIKDKYKILDIGTGNGYVLREIRQSFPTLNLDFVGIDNSLSMLDKAYRFLGVKYIYCNNEKTPFEEQVFNIITAKNVTRFDANELYRILKEGGVFIMREYAEAKGLVEVDNISKHRLIRSRSVTFYKHQLEEAGFLILKVKLLQTKKTFRNIEELITTVKSFPYIKDFSSSDEDLIKNSFKDKLTITSDPFILVAKKIGKFK